MGKINFFLVLAIFFLMPLISSAPPVTTVQQFSEGLIIIDTPQTALRQNQNFQYNFFVYNMTSGGLMSSTEISCKYIISDNRGEIVYYATPEYFSSDGHWGIDINSLNFSQSGFYYYGTRCNTSNLGGATTGYYHVTPLGHDITTAESMLHFIFLISIMFTFLLSLITSIKIPFRSRKGNNGDIIVASDIKYLKVPAIIITYLLLMFFFGLTQSILTNFLYFENLGGVFNWLYWIMFALMFPVIVVGVLLWVIHILNERKILKTLERGVMMR